jgi:hypothetical protein
MPCSQTALNLAMSDLNTLQPQLPDCVALQLLLLSPDYPQGQLDHAIGLWSIFFVHCASHDLLRKPADESQLPGL